MITVAIALSIALMISGGTFNSSRLFEGKEIIDGVPERSSNPDNVTDSGSINASNPPVRIPAEWEPQAAVWMQWPRASESGLRPNFSAIIKVLQNYEPVRIIVESSAAGNQARNFLTGEGVPLSNITWHTMPYDWSWMRDNGPVWSAATGEQIVQNWGFNGWGLGPPYADDDAVPCRVAAIEGLDCKTYQLINERGNLEFNGAGSLIANWVCQSNRNPGVSRAETETLFRQAFGLTRIVWLLSEPSDDITNGHVDGIARFIDEDTVAVARYASQTDPDAPVYEEAASIIQNAGFEIVRIDMPGYVTHNGDPLPADYMNWLVANGVVIVPGFGVPAWDAAARATIEGFFPDRDVVMVEILDIWAEGGGVHCVTNDQPIPPTISSTTDSGDYNGDGPPILPSSGGVRDYGR